MGNLAVCHRHFCPANVETITAKADGGVEKDPSTPPTDATQKICLTETVEFP
jgi:hypothetical protein